MQKKPRALILAFKNLYLNSTDDVFYEVIKSVFDCVFYGPGYTPFDQLLTDPVEIYDKYGPFDVCFVHQYVMHNLHAFPKFLAVQPKSQYFAFDGPYFCANFSNFGHRYNEIPCQKFLMSLRSDCYAFTEKEEEEYSIFDGCLIIPPPEIVSPVFRQVNFDKENFGIESTDRYINFCKDNSYRIIPLSHVIASKEFRHVPLTNKKYAISIPGIQYYERKNAYSNLLKAGYNPVQQIKLAEFVRYLMPIVNQRFNTRLEASVLGTKFIKWGFKYLIANSRVSFTDGSRVKAPVRKYFEIPAYSALLAAEKPYNAEVFGFINGKNFVECDSKSIINVLEHSLKNDDWTQEIINNSRELIKSTHSDAAWTKYMNGIYAKILAGEFNGGYWDNGTLVY